jgi:hypothetical protein
MTKNKLVRIIVVCAIVIAVVVVVAVLRPMSKTAPKTPTLVTAGCVDRATNSLKVQGNVTNTGAGLLSRRGFVYMPGTEGDPEVSVIPLVNPSFEAGALLEGWTCRNSTQVSRVSDDVKVGNYSLKYQYVGGGSYPYVTAQTLLSRTEWAGKTLTVGAWVKSTDNSTYLGFTEWGGGGWWSTGSYHPGDGQWHWLTCTATIPSNLTADWTVIILNWNTAASYEFWVDGVMLVEGTELLAVFDDGEFSEGSYSLTIDSLEPDTWYRIRAFGENEAGIGYGDVVTCKTLE